MTAQLVDRSTVDTLFGGEAELKKRVAAFKKALEKHAKTVGKPAPTEHPFVEIIVRGAGQGKFEVVDPPPEVAPELPFAPVPEPEVPKVPILTQRLGAVAAMRWRAIQRGVHYRGHRFNGDINSLNSLLATFIAAEDQANLLVRWKDADGGYIELERADILVIIKLIRTLTQTCFDNEFRLAKLLREAADDEAVAAIDIKKGWPE